MYSFNGRNVSGKHGHLKFSIEKKIFVYLKRFLMRLSFNSICQDIYDLGEDFSVSTHIKKT